MKSPLSTTSLQQYQMLCNAKFSPPILNKLLPILPLSASKKKNQKMDQQNMLFTCSNTYVKFGLSPTMFALSSLFTEFDSIPPPDFLKVRQSIYSTTQILATVTVSNCPQLGDEGRGKPKATMVLIFHFKKNIQKLRVVFFALTWPFFLPWEEGIGKTLNNNKLQIKV